MDTAYAKLGLPFRAGAVRRRHGDLRAPRPRRRRRRAEGARHGPRQPVDRRRHGVVLQRRARHVRRRRRARRPSATGSASSRPTSTRRWRCTRSPGSSTATRSLERWADRPARLGMTRRPRAAGLAGRSAPAARHRGQPVGRQPALARLVDRRPVADAVGRRCRPLPLAVRRRAHRSPPLGRRLGRRRRRRRGDGRAARRPPPPAAARPRRRPAVDRPRQPALHQPPRRRRPGGARHARRRRRHVQRAHADARRHACRPRRSPPRYPLPHRAARPARQRHRRCGAATRVTERVDGAHQAPHRRRRRRRPPAATVRVIVVHTQSPIVHHAPVAVATSTGSATLGADRPGGDDRRLQRRRGGTPSCAACCAAAAGATPTSPSGAACRARGRPSSGTPRSGGTRRSCASTTPSSTTASPSLDVVDFDVPGSDHRGLMVTVQRARPSSALNARPRCDRACFSSSVISANVRPSPSSGTNTAS